MVSDGCTNELVIWQGVSVLLLLLCVCMYDWLTCVVVWQKNTQQGVPS